MRFASCSVLSLLLAAATAGVGAPGARAAETAQVQGLIDAAEQHFVTQDYAKALAAYQDAYTESGARRLLFMIARCHQELGHAQLALTLFETFLGSGVTSEEERQRANEEVAQLQGVLNTGTLIIEVVPKTATVKVDGERLDREALGDRLSLAAGTREVEISAEGFVSEKRRVTVQRGIDTRLVAALAAEGQQSSEAAGGSGPWKWLTLAAGGAAVVAGTIFFAMGESDHAEAVEGGVSGEGDAERPALTRAEAQALIDSGDSKKLAGGVLWGVGGATLATAAVLFVLESEGGSDRAVDVVTVSPEDGGAMVWAQGRF